MARGVGKICDKGQGAWVNGQGHWGQSRITRRESLILFWGFHVPWDSSPSWCAEKGVQAAHPKRQTWSQRSYHSVETELSLSLPVDSLCQSVRQSVNYQSIQTFSENSNRTFSVHRTHYPVFLNWEEPGKWDQQGQRQSRDANCRITQMEMIRHQTAIAIICD